MKIKQYFTENKKNIVRKREKNQQSSSENKIKAEIIKKSWMDFHAPENFDTHQTINKATKTKWAQKRNRRSKMSWNDGFFMCCCFVCTAFSYISISRDVYIKTRERARFIIIIEADEELKFFELNVAQWVDDEEEMKWERSGPQEIVFILLLLYDVTH